MKAPAWIDTARAQLAPYGYTLAPGNAPGRMDIIRPNGEPSRVFLATQRRDGTGRLQARAALGGSLLWSGHDAGAFVAAFWFAEKRAADIPGTVENYIKRNPDAFDPV